MEKIKLQKNMDILHKPEEGMLTAETGEKQENNTGGWRALEQFSLVQKRQKLFAEAEEIYLQAEQSFLLNYPQIERDKLLFDEIDWEDYIEFYRNLKQKGFTKLKAIRHLYFHGIAEGKLGKYLIDRGKADKAISFFMQKIIQHPQNNAFLHGYSKLLIQLLKLQTTSNLGQDKKTKVGNLSMQAQLLLLKSNLKLKEKISQAELSLEQKHRRRIYNINQ